MFSGAGGEIYQRLGILEGPARGKLHIYVGPKLPRPRLLIVRHIGLYSCPHSNVFGILRVVCAIAKHKVMVAEKDVVESWETKYALQAPGTSFRSSSSNLLPLTFQRILLRLPVQQLTYGACNVISMLGPNV